MFYNKDGTLTLYAFSCGYVETYSPKDPNQTARALSMEHSVFHVNGFRGPYKVWNSFDSVKAARKFLHAKWDGGSVK
jgi:hypothetical protein